MSINGTNSLVNLLMSGPAATVPTVGMGATELCWTDRHAGTIVEVSKSGKTLYWVQDNAKRIDTNGMSESQEYEYAPNPTGHRQKFTLRANGRWVRAGEPAKNGTKLAIGRRESYHDFSF